MANQEFMKLVSLMKIAVRKAFQGDGGIVPVDQTRYVSEKYLKIREELSKQGKSGLECDYCGNTRSQRNHYGTFCSGCGAETKKIFGYCYGVPVYDAEDVPVLRMEMIRSVKPFTVSVSPISIPVLRGNHDE